MNKEKKFIVTVEYQGDEDIFTGDLELFLKLYKKFHHLKEIYGDIQKIDVEEYDDQWV